MSSKRIGNIGEAKVLCKFVELGIPVYVPFGDNETADLIAEFNGKLNKIQVKTSVNISDGYYIVDLRSCKNHKTTPETHYYTADEIDYFATYNITRDVVCLIPITDAPKSSVTLRFIAPTNGQTKNIRLEKDYILENIVSK